MLIISNMYFKATQRANRVLLSLQGLCHAGAHVVLGQRIKVWAAVYKLLN